MDKSRVRDEAPHHILNMSLKDLFTHTDKVLREEAEDTFAVPATFTEDDLREKALYVGLLEMLGYEGDGQELAWDLIISGEFDRVMEKDD